MNTIFFDGSTFFSVVSSVTFQAGGRLGSGIYSGGCCFRCVVYEFEFNVRREGLAIALNFENERIIF